MHIRPATLADLDSLYHLLGQLAAFENGTIRATPQDLLRDGFGPQPRFYALLAVDDADQALGLLTYFPIYSTWRGHGGAMIHDLFVTAPARGRGIGRMLVCHLREILQQQGHYRLDVCVLDWNQPARRFYQSLGLQPQNGWIIHRQDYPNGNTT